MSGKDNKNKATNTPIETEIKGIFSDVEDVTKLNDDDVMRRIEEYLEGIDPNAIEQNGVFMNPEDVIVLTDEDGNQLHFVEAAEMNMEGKTYALLQSIDNRTAEELMDGESDVYVFEVVSEDGEDKVYVPVEDDELLDDIVKNYEVMLSEYYNAQQESEESDN